MTNDIFTILIHTLLAVLGTAARQLQMKDIRQVKLVRLLSGCFISAFTGVMIYFITRALDLDSNLAFAPAGISGWVGPQVTDLVADVVRKSIGLDKRSEAK
jgi:hypothetical protein